MRGIGNTQMIKFIRTVINVYIADIPEFTYGLSKKKLWKWPKL